MARLSPREGIAVALVVLILLTGVWMLRYKVHSCNGVRCLVLDRWTGEVVQRTATRR